MRISDEDSTRISAAVTDAERHTSGEIRCVLAPTTDEPGAGAALWAAAAALIGTPVSLLAGLDPEILAGWFGVWNIGHLAAADARIASTLTVYVALQTAIFAIIYGLFSWPALRSALTPASVKKARAHAAALDQFDALGLAYTRDRTGVLLFVSAADHHAEVLADKGIYEKAPPEVWDEVVALLVEGLKRGAAADGFVAAVRRTGEILSARLPARPDDRNELPNSLVQPRPGKRKAAPKPR